MKLVVSCISLILASAVCNVVADDAVQKCIPKRAAFNQLSISPSFVPAFGRTLITIQGPYISDAIKVEIRFNDETPESVTANISEGKVTCSVPFLYTTGRVQVDMIVTRTSKVVDIFYGFIYTEKHRSEIEFGFTSTTGIKLSWDKTKFDATATLKLVLLEVVGGIFTTRGVIKAYIPNSGLFTGDLDRQGITLIQALRNVYIVQLETAIQPRAVTTTNSSPLVSDLLNDLNAKPQAEIDKMCLDWYIQDSGAPKDALPCPPTLQKAQHDENFTPVNDLKMYNPDADFGFLQKVPSKSDAAQRCVYKNGQLLVGPTSGGNVQKVSPNSEKGELAHFIADIVPWFLCCKNNKANCNLYYERRPSNNGDGYKDPHSGCVVGDPHFTTIDGLYYTFLGLGEFWVIRSLHDNFLMQGRFTQYLNTGATVCTVYVMQHRSCDGVVTIQLSLMKGYMEIMIDGQIVALESNQPTRTITYKGASIIANSQTDIRITFSSGYSFKFTCDSVVINMVILVNPQLKGSLKGLFGNFDDIQDNELTYPNGKVIPKDSNAKDIHDFGMSWKITCEESLFTYPSDKRYESFDDPSYVPTTQPLDVNKLPPKAKEICGDEYRCLFDLSVTGNVEMAISTRTTVQLYTTITETFSVSCPKITVPNDGNLDGNNFQLGSQVKLRCNDKFTLKGNDSIKCVKNARGELAWDRTLGECANPCANTNVFLQWSCERGFPVGTAT